MARPRGFEPDEALDRAMATFWRRGYGDTSLPDLLTDMGISRSSFYDTFGGKRAVFEAALERYEQAVISPMVAAIERPGPVRAVLGALLDRMVDEAVADGGRGCLVSNTAVELAPHDDDARAVLSRIMGRVEAALRARLEQARAAGELRDDADPDALARTILALFNGLWVIAKMRPGRAALQDIARTGLSVLDAPTVALCASA